MTSRQGMLMLLKITKHDDDIGFQRIIFGSVASGLISEKKLARLLDASVSTLGRWAYGKTTPHPKIRKIIFSRLKKFLNK